VRWIWSASPAASGLARGLDLRGLSPRGLLCWLGLDRCGCLCSAASVFVARIFIYFFFSCLLFLWFDRDQMG
jgi:hypothetical protein